MSLSSMPEEAERKSVVQYYDERRGNIRVWKIFWTVVAMAVVLIAVGYVVQAVVFGGSVATADIRGRGEQEIQFNDPVHRTQSQEWFEQMYGNIKSYNRQIQIQAKARDDYQKASEGKSDPLGSIASEQARLSQVVAGLKDQCVQAVSDYNAEARKVSKARFVSADLPSQIDPSDPRFSCEEVK